MGSKAAPTFDPKGAADVVSAEFEAHVRAAHASKRWTRPSDETCAIYEGNRYIGEGKWLEDTKNIIDTHNASLQSVHASEPINLGQIIRARLERLAADLPAVADVLKTEAVALESLVNESRAAHAGEEPAHASEELIDNIMGDLVRETNIFPNQVERAKQILRKRLSVKKKVMNAGLKKVKK